MAGIAGLLAVAAALYVSHLLRDVPSLEQLENPAFQLAAVAYTADGSELVRFSTENRSWAPYERISPHVIDALVATEDHRFFQHDGVDYFRTVSAVGQTVLAKLGVGDYRTQGGSTITQQLARNLYDDQIGFDRSVTRKLKEMVTARQLERRYEKRDIIELYLNTVQFGYNAYGIETAAHTYFGKSAVALTVPEGAVLVGMLRAITRYNPVRNPENALERRNVVLALMERHGSLNVEERKSFAAEPVGASYHSSATTTGPAPHFAQVLYEWLEKWGAERGIDVKTHGLRIHTTIDSRLQERARAAVEEQLAALQAVVDYEWSRESDFYLGDRADLYAEANSADPFRYFWQRPEADPILRETPAYRRLRRSGMEDQAVLASLRADADVLDSLRTVKNQLQAGLVSIDPRNGHIRVWVGGREIEQDWNDHVAGTRRQPGSTFKPFVYTAAIDNGYPPTHTLPDRPLTYRGRFTQNPWSPQNFGGATGGMITLRRALATSNNLITARVITELITPPQVTWYARRMGIESPMTPVASLGLGTSEVTLLELTAAYTTLASGGKYYRPTFVTRIEDLDGNVLYEAEPGPEREVLPSRTAFTVVDMLRDAVKYGTAVRLRGPQFRLGAYDLAAKTGTTQGNADGWFMLMHPDLVTGTWVGFNDRRVTFRSRYWGQGAHNALFVAGTFFRNAVDDPEIVISKNGFPGGNEYGIGPKPQVQDSIPVRRISPRSDRRNQ